MAQKLPVDGFEWDKNNSKFNKNFIKKYDKDSKNGYILEVDVEYPKGFHSLQSNFCQKKWEVTNAINLYAIYMIKKLIHRNLIHIRALQYTVNHGLVFKQYKE